MSAAKEETLQASKSTTSSCSSRRRPTVSQMFGIYRARTPDTDKLEAPPGKHTRALFLSAVVTGVALVVGLTLLDVSTNSSNLKSTPVLHLTRHRQDLFVDNSRTSEAPDILGIVEEINETTQEDVVTSVVNITELSTTVSADEGEKGEDVSNKNNDKVRTGRTKLFPIESLKRHRTQYLKDYFVDGKHDPQSIGYYILQKQNGEYYLRNYSEPMWGTRIRRRFSNRMYPPQPLGTNPFQFVRRSDNIDVPFPNYGRPKFDNRNRQHPIDRHDTSRRNLQTMTTLRKYFNPYSKRVDTGLHQTGSNTFSNHGTADHPFLPTSLMDDRGKDDSDPSSYYQFTPIPVFSDAYAQLDPYRNNREIKSIKDIVKYLTTSTSTPNKLERNTTPATITTSKTLESFRNEDEEEKLEDLITTSSAAKVTRLKPPSHQNFHWKDARNQTSNKINRKRGMRIKGSYRMPIEPEDLRSGASGLVETLVPPPMHAFMFPGNSTEPDPFAKFRPYDPSEINQLAVPRPSRPPGSMFMNKIKPISGAPIQYFPKPSVDITRHPVHNGISLNPNHPPPHTVALFKPSSSSGRQKYLQSSSIRKKPVSVTLDIYPMTMDNEHGYQQDEGAALPNKYDDMDSNDQWSPRNPDIGDKITSNQQMESQGSDNHMVVHLNVYPKGVTSNYRNGAGRQPFWNPPLPIAAYQKRAMSDFSASTTTAVPDETLTKEANSTEGFHSGKKENSSFFLEYDSYDLPPSLSDEEYPAESNAKLNRTTDNGNPVPKETKKEDNRNGKDKGNSIIAQRIQSTFNETDNYGKLQGTMNGDETNHWVEKLSSKLEQDLANSSHISKEAHPVNLDEQIPITDMIHKNYTQREKIKMKSISKDDNRNSSTGAKESRYHYRVKPLKNNNPNPVNSSKEVSKEIIVDTPRNCNETNHRGSQDAIVDGSSVPEDHEDYHHNHHHHHHHQEDNTGYDYDLEEDHRKDDYEEYFVNDSDDNVNQKQ